MELGVLLRPERRYYLRGEYIHERFIARGNSKYSKMVRWGNQSIPLVQNAEDQR